MGKAFYPLKVAAVEKNTADCTLISLDIPKEIQEEFQFTQGQHLTFRIFLEGEEIRRTYSLCTSPIDKSWQVAVKQIPKGKFSTFANSRLKAGDILEVMPPEGRFFIKHTPETACNYVAFAAGSGITPILSQIKTHLALEPQCTFKLFYTSRQVQSIILREEIEALKNLYLDRFEVYHFLTREEREIPLFNGRIDRTKLDTLFSTFIDPANTDEYLLCGPQEMVFLIQTYLEEQGVPKKHIHFELFFTDTPPKISIQNGHRQGKGEHNAEIVIWEGGKAFTFTMVQGGGTILDAALSNGADLPYACKGGVCCTCRAKLREGEVDMDVHYALEDEEVENGYILSCQARPMSEKLVVDFDG